MAEQLWEMPAPIAVMGLHWTPICPVMPCRLSPRADRIPAPTTDLGYVCKMNDVSTGPVAENERGEKRRGTYVLEAVAALQLPGVAGPTGGGEDGEGEGGNGGEAGEHDV